MIDLVDIGVARLRGLEAAFGLQAGLVERLSAPEQQAYAAFQLAVADDGVAGILAGKLHSDPISPIQYGLVGLALATFFLLLVSLSWQIATSVACIGLLGFNLSAVLRSVAMGGAFAMMLGLLYAALVGLRACEGNALVLGAGMLFAILAAIMVVTRRIGWHRLSATAAAA